jgi:A/G-specific adenine glycosylase
MMKKDPQKRLKTEFARRLLKWNREMNTRQMPWKGETDPYKIWLSEIILQQTRVEQGWNYYNNFIKAFPGIHQLAKATDKKIFKLWEGLGYYSRCRNLIATARFIATEKKGIFPNDYEEIKSLKGIGPYTAAAISSFAFNLPYAVVDGNVFRVLSRIFGIDKPADSTAGKKFFTDLANELLDKKQAGIYNQAIMDFGAVICKPAAPACTICPFRKNCFAFQHDKINELPVKSKKLIIKKRWFYYLVLKFNNKTAIRHRVEATGESNTGKVLQQAIKKKWLSKNKYDILSVSPLVKQQLSHQQVTGRFIEVSLEQKPAPENDWRWVAGSAMGKYAFPGFINQYLGQ